MTKTLIRTAMFCLLLTITVACIGEQSSVPPSSNVAVAERTNMPTTAPTSTSFPTSTVAPTPTEEPPPTVEATSRPETTDAEGDEIDKVAAAIDITMILPVGDPRQGEELVEAKACSGCHFIGRIGVAPSWKAEIYAGGKGIATRAKERWQKSGYSGGATSETEYLVESILMPGAYVIEGYMGGTMPTTYRELLTDQELADIISYLLEIE